MPEPAGAKRISAGFRRIRLHRPPCVLVVKGMLRGPLGTLLPSGSMHRWFPAMVPESAISVPERPSSCTNLVGAGGFEPPASRL
jgi:hypothetical protein